MKAAHIVHRVLPPTPLQKCSVDGVEMWLKCEQEQPTGSFKVRGALSAIGHLVSQDFHGSVVACSAGNHGLGVAFASRHFGIAATVVVPATASIAKVEKLKQFSVELILHGKTYDEAEAFALDLSEQRNAHFLSPYNDAWVIAGQGSIGLEILEQLPTLGSLVVAVGGGGLLSGCVLALSERDVEVRGAQVEQNAAFASSLRGDRPESLGRTIADGIAGGIDEHSITLDIARSLNVAIDFVNEEATRRAVQLAYKEAGLIIEGSAAVALAIGLQRASSLRQPLVVVLSGGNIDPALHAELLATPDLF